MKYNLFLDDVREPKDVTWIKLPDVNWTIVKNYIEFVDTIMKNGIPEIISFDHDLAQEHYRPSMYNRDRHYNKYYTDGTFKEKTGYECAKWLVKYCMDKNLPFPVYYVHTMNPIGSENITKYIENYITFGEKTDIY
jgi:hypothetical protein